MPRSYKGYRYILCIIDEVTNFLVTVPIFQTKSEEVGEALLEHVITKYCIPEYIIMDQDSAFMSSLMTYLFHRLDIKIKTIAPYNHQSLQAEHGIKSLTHILTKHLTSLGQIKVSRNFREYYESLNKIIKYLQDLLFNFRLQRLAMINKNRENFQYRGGDLVYIISPLTSKLRTNSQKTAVKYVGPVVIYKIVDPHNYLLMTLDGIMLKGIFEHKRLKPAIIRTSHGNVQNLAELRQVMNTDLKLEQYSSCKVRFLHNRKKYFKLEASFHLAPSQAFSSLRKC